MLKCVLGTNGALFESAQVSRAATSFLILKSLLWESELGAVEEQSSGTPLVGLSCPVFWLGCTAGHDWSYW